MMRRFAQLLGGGYSPLPDTDESADPHGVPHGAPHGAHGGAAAGASGVARALGRLSVSESPRHVPHHVLDHAPPSAPGAEHSRSARTEGARGLEAGAVDDRSDLSSPVAFFHLARSSLVRAMAWAPFTTEDAQYMLDNLCDAAQTALTPQVKPPEWQRYLVFHADYVDEMDEHWQGLPGLRDRHAAQFDATLAQPLEGPLDHYLQMQVGLAEAHFQRARDAFFDRRFAHAQAFDRQGLLFCERARDTLLCHRHGTQQEQLALMSVIDAAKAKREPPEAEQALANAAAWRSRGTLPPWPPSRETTSAPETPGTEGSTGEAVTPAQSGAPTPSGPPAAPPHRPAPDFWERLADASVILRQEGAQIDPGRHLDQLLHLLIQESQEASVARRPEYAAVLDTLHEQIGAARLACEQLKTATHALATLAQVLQRHPQWRAPMAALQATASGSVNDARRALAEGQHGEARRLAEDTGRTLRHAVRRIQQAEAGQWPDAKAQWQRQSECAELCTRLRTGRSPPSNERLLKRAEALLHALNGAETREQAAALLTRLEEALGSAQLAARRAGDKPAFWQAPKAWLQRHA